MSKMKLEPNPMEFAPSDAASQKRYAKLAKSAERGLYKDSIKLKCLDCCGWEYTEAKKCEVTGCPLFAANRKIFGIEIVAEARKMKPDCKTKGCTNKVFVASTGLCSKCLKERKSAETD